MRASVSRARAQVFHKPLILLVKFCACVCPPIPLLGCAAYGAARLEKEVLFLAACTPSPRLARHPLRMRDGHEARASTIRLVIQYSPAVSPRTIKSKAFPLSRPSNTGAHDVTSELVGIVRQDGLELRGRQSRDDADGKDQYRTKCPEDGRR